MYSQKKLTQYRNNYYYVKSNCRSESWQINNKKKRVQTAKMGIAHETHEAAKAVELKMFYPRHPRTH